VKSSKAQIHGRFHKIPTLRFEDQSLTSFAGAVIFQALFARLGLKERLRECFERGQRIFGPGLVLLCLVMHLLLGFRRLRSIDYYRDDTLLRHILGLRGKLPDVSTISRSLSEADAASVEKVRATNKEMVLQRIEIERLSRITVDLDGTVISTKGRNKEGTAVGFNKLKKGARSYYPLLATVAQLGEVFDHLFRSGNVHDSKGAKAFALDVIALIRQRRPAAALEVRADSAFFDENMLMLLDAMNVEFTVSVPFERFTELKGMIEGRKRWTTIDKTWDFFEDRDWQPKKWEEANYRFLFYRARRPIQRKGPIQLDLYEPQDHEYEYKVVVTNKQDAAAKVLVFHNGRGCQEGLIGELKQGAQFDYIPFNRQVGNQLFLNASILAHNLGRELQMATQERSRKQSDGRVALWDFRKLTTLRQELLLRAGRLTRPGNDLTLTMSANQAVAGEVAHIMRQLAA
jgi:hypothetical protein